MILFCGGLIHYLTYRVKDQLRGVWRIIGQNNLIRCNILRQLEKRSEEIEKLLDEKRVLSREDRRNIVSTLKNVRQELKSNIPYLQKLFAEQMDKTVTEAKGEFETYLQNKMNSIALAAISEQMKQEEISLNRNMIPELEVQEGGEEAGEMEAGMHMDM